MNATVPAPLRWWWMERQINREFKVKMNQARGNNDRDEIQRLEYQHHWDSREIHESRTARSQRKWIRKARKFMIPVPPQDYEKLVNDSDENWDYWPPSGEALLKKHVMLDLRREVRREQKERDKQYMRWVTLAIGLVGAVTGLVSVFFR